MAALNVGNLELQITADGSSAISELNQVQNAAQNTAGAIGRNMPAAANTAAAGMRQVGEAGRQAGQQARQSLEQIGKKMSDIGGKLTKTVTLPIVGLMGAAVKGASDLTETVGKTEVVFGDMTDRVMKWSETSVSSMGLAQGSALEFASTYGDMATGMGLSQTAATNMAMSLTQLAADMASFKNISTDLAAEKLNAVFTGETEGLKQLGIVMTQTNLQAFAMSQGITKSVSSMSQAEQVMLRYRYVMEATKNSQGDFARTGDSLANQSRKLAETVKQMGESFGSQLVPLVTPVVEKLQQFAQALSEMSSGAKNMILAIGMVAAAIGPLLLVGGKLLTFIAAVKTALATLAINPVVLALTAAAAAVAAIAGITVALNKANADVDRTAEAYERMKEAVEGGAEGNVTVTDSTGSIDTITGAIDDAISALDTLSTGDYGTVTIKGETTDIDRLIADLKTNLKDLRGTVYVDGDGNAVIGNAGLLNQIRSQISTLEAVIPFVADEGKRAELQGVLDQLKADLAQLETGAEIGVNLTTEGQEDLEAARDLVTELQGEHFGKVVIDGETTDVDGLIDDIQTKLNAIDALIKMDGDPAEINADIEEVRGQISTLRAVIPYIEDESARELLEQHLTSLQSKIDGVSAGVTVTATFTGDDQERKIQAFADAVAKLPKDETYSATGEFNISGASTEAIQEYANSIAAAATATGDYATAVDAMNKAVDTETQRKVNEVNTQTAETLTTLQKGYEDGTITQEAYDKAWKQTIDDGNDKIAQIQREAETQKKLNEVLNDGNRENDYAATQELYGKYVTEGEGGVTQAETQKAMQRLNAQKQSGGDMTEVGAEGGIVAAGILNTAADQYEKLGAALGEYQSAMQSANQTEQQQVQMANENAETYGAVKDALQIYQDNLVNGSETALDAARQSLEGNQKALDAFDKTVNSGKDGLLNFKEASTEISAAMQNQTDAEKAATQAAADADTARQQAADTLKASATEIAGMQGMTADAIGGALDAASEAGAVFTEAQAAAAEGGQGIMDSLTTALSLSDTDVGAAVQEALNSLTALQPPDMTPVGTGVGESLTQSAASAISSGAGEMSSAASGAVGGAVDAMSGAASGTSSIGSALIAGARAGVMAAAGSLASAAANAVRAAVQAAKNAAVIRSPSRVMRDEVGKPLTQGIAVGMEAQVPESLKSVRGSVRRLMSGAAQVASGGIQARAAIPAAPGINYDQMGEAMSGAMSRVGFSFSVGETELAQSTRDANSRQVAFRARQVNRGYGV